ncbi:plasmid recombination protein [Lactobacillus delbrueckii]
MGYLVARMQKMKAGNLVDMGNHNQRLTDNHSNKDIDTERSYLNYDLVWLGALITLKRILNPISTKTKRVSGQFAKTLF